MALLRFRGINLEDFEQLAVKDPDTRYLVFNSDGSIYGEYIGDKLIGTAERVKQLYEENEDTNAFTDTEKAKLSGIEEGAEVNTVSPEDLDADNISFDGSDTNYLVGETEVESAIKELDTRVKANADNVELKVNTSDVVDNLASTDVDKPLSANQGKVLKDTVDLLDTRVEDLELETERLDDEVIRVEQKADAHIEDVDNPHGVTAEQVDTYVKTTIDSKDADTLQAAKDFTYSRADIDNKDVATLQEAKDYTHSKTEIDNKDAVVLQGAKDYTDILGGDVLELQGKVEVAEDKIEDIEDGTTIVKKAEQDASGNVITSTYETKNDATSKLANKVDKTQKIIGIDLQDDILLTEFKTALGNATQSVAGLLSAEDKTHLDGLVALLESSDDNNVVDTIGEILEIFNNYPEGADLVTVLNGKVDKVEGKGLSQNDFSDFYKAKLDEMIAFITYADLVSLRANETLEKGAFYRIIDYETKTVQPETRSAGHYFDVIVQALDEKTLSENAQAIHSERDTDGYFDGVNLGAWKLKYSLDNDNEQYYWADTVNGKGVIYRMIDEYGNDLPYDFKNIQFRRYKIISYAKNTTLVNQYYALKDMGTTVRPSGAEIYEEYFIWAYTFTVIDANSVANDVSLNKNKTFGDDLGNYYYTENNKTGSSRSSAESKKTLGNNVLLYDYNFYGYIMFYGFSSNTIGDNFKNNTIGESFKNNTIGNSFSYNAIGNDFQSNAIGNDFSSNTIGNGFGSNTIGNEFRSNTIGNDFHSNAIEKSFNSNTIGYGFSSNAIGESFGSNTIGESFSSNTIGNSFYYNTIGYEFRFNTIGNVFSSNTIGNFFYYNTIGNDIKYITFSVDGTNSLRIRYLYLKSGLIGTSSANKLDLYYSGLYHRTYPTTFEIIANNNIVSSCEATPLTRAGKVKETKTTATWADI